jgi:hypothetical protein
MSEWWTYRLSDFLMFAPGTYWRLVAQYNQAYWPMHALAAALGVALLVLARSAHRRPLAARLVPALLAACWAWVGWAFHWQRHAEINTAAQWLAMAFFTQAALLAVLALWPTGGTPNPRRGTAENAGWWLALAGLAVYPLLGSFAGRPWSQGELFGMAPDPTAWVSIGLLLAMRNAWPVALRWLALLIPVLAVAVGLATLWTMAG